MPYDPNLQFQFDNSRRQQQRQAEYAHYRRRRGGRSRGGFVVLLLLVAVGIYVYRAQPEVWQGMVDHVQNLVDRVKQDGPH